MAFRISLFMILLAAGISLSFVAKLKPVGPGPWLFFSIWLLLPYAVVAVSLWRRHRRQHEFAIRQFVLTAITISFGIVALADIVVWRPDPQGALAILMIPPLQIMIWFIMIAMQSLRLLK